MDHFFSIPELVELMCEGLGHPRVHRKDLAALARTATVFRRPALDLLWQHQDSANLINIILCILPADLWESEDLVKASINLPSSRPITSSDLDRTLIYSRRVKSLSMNSYDLTLDLFRILEVMKPFLPQGILFPNLRQLDLFLKDERDRTIIPYLSFALVTSICLRLESWPSLPNLPLVYPALKHLKIYSYSDPAHLLTSTSTCARKLVRIEELTLPTLDRAVYDHLSTLPTLRSLSLTEGARDPLPSHPEGRTGFPVLRNLETRSITLGFVTEVVNGFSNTPLRSLNVTTDTLDAEHIIRHFFAALSTHLAHSALEQITLKLGFKDRRVGSDIDGQMLSQLLCFSNFREVSIYLAAEFHLDDAAIWDMARAWPNLVKLEVADTQNRSSPPPIMTLASLRAFATHCPELTTLALTFDATVVPPSSDEQPILQKKISALHVCFSPISSPALVGRFLSGIFPNMEEIQSFGRSSLWKEVEAVVKRGGI
ncbi:hypothetical protein C8J57DRAFT_1719948 [Mycena rebaudengoi]|nr:hypothetical protein C8J57DRAFT_1722550 [Mycena rebaudengoi]KAJ7260539.1 hypothetical protein C8J57DRAFT_1719948 [Mycena rebaudengoi]